MDDVDPQPPSLADIRQAHARLGDTVRRTPTWAWQDPELTARLGADTNVFLKLELFQHAGSFKPRGALLRAGQLDEEALGRGFVAVSAGNHAMAVGHAARSFKTTAKVVMPQSANPARVQRCKRLGAEVLLVPDVHAAFAEVDRIVAQEGRTFIHPFEGETATLGTATVALEFLEDAGELDAVIIPIGGGGLCAGMATAIKAMQPRCLVFGVEPTGADSMHRSFAAGSPQAIDKVTTIADSLGAPHAAPYSFALCRRFVDDLVVVDDDQLCGAMRWLFGSMKIVAEPAAAAATAALLGPLRERLAGKRVGLVVCGSNIDAASFATYLERGKPFE